MPRAPGGFRHEGHQVRRRHTRRPRLKVSMNHIIPSSISRDVPHLLGVARALWDAGLCPLPRVSGHVEPSWVDQYGEVRSILWGGYKIKQPPWEKVAPWFTHGDLQAVGVVLLTGSHAHPRAPHAAFLQIIDIESPDVFEAFEEDLHFRGHGDILHRLVRERTPSGGAHLGFLCPTISDKQKLPLARRAADNKILIELLQHQPCTVAPTQMRCKPEHPPGVPYQVVHGRWEHPLEISAAQRQILLESAQAFNEVPERVAPTSHDRGGEGERPGDRLGAEATAAWWEESLARYGWRDVSRPGLRSQGIWYFQRPGKVGRQPSATYGKTGAYLYVFSSNAQPFDADTAYSPFAAYALLVHDGNYGAAARALAEQYGMTRPGYPTAGRRARDPLDHPPDFVDPWLGPRSTWCGIPLRTRRLADD